MTRNVNVDWDKAAILVRFNTMSSDQAKIELYRVCSSKIFCEKMNELRPFTCVDQVILNAKRIWNSLGESEWLEAFSAHPRIGVGIGVGAGKSQLKESKILSQEKRKNDEDVSGWAQSEQSLMSQASFLTTEKLAKLNEEYYAKFGFVFLICATGKTGDEMLKSLEKRIKNTRRDEIENAAIEKVKIIELRFYKLFRELSQKEHP